MFFKKKERKQEFLSDFVKKKTASEYVFLNINNDLGHAVAHGVSDWPPLMLMAYAYARRAAVAALFIQGVATEESYEHVKAFFKSIQMRTDATVAFQEKAFDVAMEYMKTYNQAITKIFIIKMTHIADEYDSPAGEISDDELFKEVIEIVYLEQQENIAHNEDGYTKKYGLEDVVKDGGVEFTANKFSEIIIKMIPSKEVAYQFVIEDIEAASQGNEVAQIFARNSGISPKEYKGALDNSKPEVGELQNLLWSLCQQLSLDFDMEIVFRTKIVDNVMKNFLFGKYGNESGSFLVERAVLIEGVTEEDIIAELISMSESPNDKTTRTIIKPVKQMWSWSFEFSDEEYETSRELISTLSKLRNGDFVAQSFNIDKKR